MTKHFWRVLDHAAAQRRRLSAEEAGVRVVRLRGSRMRTAAGVFDEFARGLSFPTYFGRNWAALEDCLADLDWLDPPVAPAGLVCLVDDGDLVLDGEPASVRELWLDLLDRVGAHWEGPIERGQPYDRPAGPVRFLLVGGRRTGPAG